MQNNNYTATPYAKQHYDYSISTQQPKPIINDTLLYICKYIVDSAEQGVSSSTMHDTDDPDMADIFIDDLPIRLRPIDYASDNSITLSVDTENITVKFKLSQRDKNGIHQPARYGSIPINERESAYSQAKSELYGLYRALRHWKIYIIGAKRLQVEMDARYVKGILTNAEPHPNAAMNRWIQEIVLFDFEIIYVPPNRAR